LGAYQPFDPALISSFTSSRIPSPATNQLQGAPPALTALSQTAQFTYSQTFQSGTNTGISFNGNKSDSNSSFFFINPYLFANLTFQLTQPLLRKRGLYANRAPIVIARRNLEQSRQTFQAQVSASLQQAINQYWSVIQSRESLKVTRASLEQAEATYQQNKRALELGALPPLDIYRSEAEVATRRVAVIQAEYALKQSEDQFRQVIGADLDPYVRALDLDLVENPEPAGELLSTDATTALEQALKQRPELEAVRQQLLNDDTNLRVSHNALLPDLELTGFYTSTGLGGNQISLGGPPTTVMPGGFRDALSQLFGFGFPAYGFTVSLNLPIKNRLAEASLGRAAIAKRNDLYLLRRQEQSITLEVVNAVHGLEQAKLAMSAAKIARDLAQKSLEAEQRKYELGEKTIFFVLDAQREAATAEVTLVQAEIGYQMALGAVDHATGALLERHHIQISDSPHP